MFSGVKKFDWTIVLAVCGLALILFGGQALVAWHGGKSLLPDELWLAYLIPYDSAWAFVLCGAALIAFRSNAPIVVALCAGGSMLIGVVRLLDYFIPGLAFSVTPILAHPWLPDGVYDDLSLMGALCFVVSGYTIGALKHPPYSVARSIMLEFLAFVLVVLALFSIIGSYNPAPLKYRWVYLDDLDAVKAVAFLLLGISILGFVFFGSRDESLQARRWAPAAVWLAAFVGTLALWQGLRIEEARQIQANTIAVTDAVGRELTREIDARVRTLERFASRWNNFAVSTARWRQEAGQLLRDVPEFRAVGWADADMTMRWIEPDGPAGGSLLRDRVREMAARAAQNKRSPALTKAVDLRIGGRGFQAYVPVYDADEFEGLIIGTFVHENWLESLLKDRFPRHSIVVSEDDEILFQARVKANASPDEWTVEKQLALYNNSWRLRVAPTLETLGAGRSALPEMVLAGGMLLATFLAAAVFLYQIVAHRTRHLSKANTLLALDIDARKQTERALRESEHRIRIIIDGVNDHAIFMLDINGKIRTWNKGAEQLTGYRSMDAIGRRLSLLYPPDAMPPLAEKLSVAQSTGRYVEECWHVCKNGSRFCGDDVISPLRGANGGLEGYAVITRDQTERIKLLNETEHARDYYLRLFSSFPNLVWRTDASGQCDYCNPAWLDFTGRSQEEESGAGWMESLHPDDRAAWTEAFNQSLDSREPFEIQYRLRRANGQYGWIICSCRPYYDMHGELAGYLASCYDNTIRRRMEAEVETSRERILAFSRHLRTAREEEKALVARELHDELGATLTALRLEASILLKKIPAGQNGGKNGNRSVIQLADSAIQAIRKIITDLHPSILDNLGLLPALRWHAGEFSKRSGIKVEVETEGEEVQVEKAHTLAFFRITQEALTNVLKHAQARNVVIRFKRTGSYDILNITDDGLGMASDATNPKPSSHGILGMRDRARELHGEFKIASAIGKGTAVTVILPARSG